MYLKNAISRKQNPPRSLIITSEQEFGKNEGLRLLFVCDFVNNEVRALPLEVGENKLHIPSFTFNGIRTPHKSGKYWALKVTSLKLGRGVDCQRKLAQFWGIWMLAVKCNKNLEMCPRPSRTSYTSVL
jgi:hypothetical protein